MMKKTNIKQEKPCTKIILITSKIATKNKKTQNKNELKREETEKLKGGLSPTKLIVKVRDRLFRTQKTIRGCTPGGLYHEGFPHQAQHKRHHIPAHYE